jgi:hypothetical protein
MVTSKLSKILGYPLGILFLAMGAALVVLVAPGYEQLLLGGIIFIGTSVVVFHFVNGIAVEVLDDGIVAKYPKYTSFLREKGVGDYRKVTWGEVKAFHHSFGALLDDGYWVHYYAPGGKEKKIGLAVVMTNREKAVAKICRHLEPSKIDPQILKTIEKWKKQKRI